MVFASLCVLSALEGLSVIISYFLNPASSWLCDHGAMDDSFHMVMQCSALQPNRTAMFNEIEQIRRDYEHDQIHIHNNVYLTLMEKPGIGFTDAIMEDIWKCSARHISNMYRWKLRAGIG